MKVKIPTIKNNERLFFISYILFLSFSIMTHSFYYRYIIFLYKPIIITCMLMIVMQELANKKLSIKAFAGALVFSIVAIFVVIRGEGFYQMAFGCTFIFSFAARNIKFEKICSVTVIVTMVLLSFIILSMIAGLLPNYHFVSSNRSRYYLGFRYALNGPSLLFNSILLITYLKGSKIKLLHIIILYISAFFLYKATDARLSYYLSAICLIVAAINKFRRSESKKIEKFSSLLVPIFIVCCILSIWISVSYNPNVAWMAQLNELLGYRLRLAQISILLYGIRLFGSSNIEWIGNGLDGNGQKLSGTYSYVDNMYVQLVQRYGIIFLIVFIVFITILMYQLFKKKQYLLLILLSLRAFHGIVDDGGLYLHFNTFWILFGPAIFGYIRAMKSNNIEKVKGRRAELRIMRR